MRIDLVFSIIGFLLGVTAAGSAGYYYLLDEYNSASASLLMSVNELQASTDKVIERDSFVQWI